jgi:uncharacterized protein
MQTEELKNIYKWVWIVLIILAVFLGVRTLASLKDLRNTSPSYNTINVTGEGEVFAIPDIASFSFTISADAKTVSEAQEQVTDKMETVIGAIRGLGIEEKDIKTTDYSVYPRYSYTQAPCTQFSCPPSRQVLEGYTATQNVSVKVRETKNAGDALAAAGEKGATGLSNISFTVDDPEKLTEEARKMAIENAREKAEVLSDELGVRLVRVVSFYDSSDNGGVMPMYREMVGMGSDGKDIAVAQSAPPIPVGENKYKVMVNVVYEIR